MTTLLTKPQKESRLYVTKPPEESKNLLSNCLSRLYLIKPPKESRLYVTKPPEESKNLLSNRLSRLWRPEKNFSSKY